MNIEGAKRSVPTASLLPRRARLVSTDLGVRKMSKESETKAAVITRNERRSHVSLSISLLIDSQHKSMSLAIAIAKEHRLGEAIVNSIQSQLLKMSHNSAETILYQMLRLAAITFRGREPI